MSRPFETASRYPLLTFEQAWALVAAQARPLAPIRLPLSELAGLALAEDLSAGEDVPPFAASTMDGYALCGADGSAPRRVLGELEAGGAPGLAVGPGTCARIMTGAPLPPGADAVLPVEETREAEGWMHPARAARPGENVRPVGADIPRGATVLRAGQALGPAEIGLLAALNRAQALAHPRPRVAILATGDELVAPGGALAHGQIVDSNSPALAAAAALAGAQVTHVARAADSEDALRAALQRALAEADVVLTTGGVSMGTRDLVKPLLAELGAVHFGRVAIKPGKPLTFATVGRSLVFGLPGNPVSTLVMFELFVRPALRLLGGQRAIQRPRASARLRAAIRHEPDRLEFQRAVLTEDADGPWADITGGQSSSRLLSMVGANALVLVPQGTGDLPAGAWVEAVWLDRAEVEPNP